MVYEIYLFVGDIYDLYVISVHRKYRDMSGSLFEHISLSRSKQFQGEMIMPEYKEYCIRVEELNIKALRDFQMLDFPLQKQNGAFKPSPLGSYDDTVLEAKRRNRLAGCIEDIEKASRG